ncbi:LSU ribosomal maturation GTPase RbgA (B. subtilis YlqF) [hydrothermal vent metagenome]|uniref:LSU ribosomal maturation GTPase RbgA (B. subtilis YlqF) n=1 Tax=hydrothermal vent metagenome TaxID=652676 RepID=A0A3B0W9E4_9ZZZZ
MAVQWYPGHMNKARRIIKDTMSQVDLVIEVMDARIPFSSENPMVAELRQHRPCIKILNKSDLADPEITKLWMAHLEKEQGVKAQALSVLDKSRTKNLPNLCRKLLPERGSAVKSIRVMIMGIPNVGKSTLINTLAGKTLAKVGDEPAVTKMVSSAQQRILLEGNIVLSDTPGILWPKIENGNSSYRLAITGAIKNTAFDFEDIALFAADYLIEAYSERIVERYKLKQCPKTGIELLEEIGRRRGLLRAGGIIDMQRTSEILIHEIRNGTLGALSFETPEMIAEETAISDATL